MLASLPRRRQALLLVDAALLAGLAPLLALGVAGPSTWDLPVLGALAAIAALSTRWEATLPGRNALGALTGVGLVAVALLGPLPALVVLATALLLPAATGRERLRRPGNLANATAAVADVLVVALVLGALGTGPAGLLAAAAAQLLADWAVGPALFGTLWTGAAPRVALGALARSVPSEAVVAALATGTVLLVPAAGVLALAAFALALVTPRATIALLARTGPVARVQGDVATARYAQALALELRLDRAARERVAAVARIVADRRPTGNAVDHMVATLADRSGAACDAGHVTERWDGTGGPAAVAGTMIPVAARVVAVADAWSRLTAAGTAALPHAEAIERLRAAAGTRLDPAVVDAAARIALGLAPAGEVGLRHRTLPAALRRRLPAGGARGAFLA